MATGRGWIRSSGVGVVIGVLAGGLVVFLVEGFGHRLFGIADPDDLSSVTTPMFVSVLIAWVLGSAVAGAVATRWSDARTPLPGAIAGAVLLAGAVSNLFVIPHPVWMAVGAVVLMPLAAYVAARRWAGPAASVE